MNSGMTQISHSPTASRLNSAWIGNGNLITHGLGLGLGGEAANNSNSRKNRNNALVTIMRDRSNNRKPLQKGRNLSIEAIQTVQALKRARATSSCPLEPALETTFRRLLKLDMIAVLRELIRQNQCYLALKVFEEIQEEYWYRPQISLYAELVSLLGSNGLLEEVELLFIKLKKEPCLEPDINGFNALLEILANFNLTGLAVECFYLMKSIGCDLDKLSFKILINVLESNEEASLSAFFRLEAQKYFGQSLNFQEKGEGEGYSLSSN
ncbi:protein THYLAKOID ASSEMBLY 8-like, chloroplastic [Coffea eugenioides]|uniref:protein THYLAKOID ASSEMBLY 8-like, chloroplastic n=1 Tax=Coffea eugenioides TaxID=49369 RepID=UPI000F604B06|nr:protein THYLAKOID ASSEMBLY 8-like, chloroplastic [Coffea eugenioides]XP_027185742.1 protein THYLAKOID ASSEMBLY 8-like, chloroplastic [Coffea eugenioides]